MDDLNCCLSDIIDLCNEASIFLNQLYRFEYQLKKFSLSYKISSEKYFSILNHFSIILNDLNIYYKNDFLKFYSKILNYLSRKYFTINYSNDFTEDFNYFVNYQRKYYKNIFYCLHKLFLTCNLCIQYRRLCTNIEFTERFVYIRMDLINDLEKLNQEIQFLLIKINSNFQYKKQFLIKNSKENISISNLIRTIFLWFILFIIIYYFFWPVIDENNFKHTWPI